MSMFRGLLILVLGIFFINVTKKGQNTLKKIPIFGEPIDKLFKKLLIALTAAWSAAFSSPLPIRRELDKAATSVTLTASSAKLRSRNCMFIYIFA